MTVKQVWSRLAAPKTQYFLYLILAGIASFIVYWRFPVDELSEWVLLYSLVASIVILNHLTFQLPPSGTRQSMDSAVILATMYVYGINMAMYALLISYIVYYFLKRKDESWKHIANFSMYSVMIFGAWNMFQLLGGSKGELDPLNIYAYAVSLILYFTINTLLIGLYSYLVTKKKFYVILNGMLKEVLSAYFSMLLMSLVLTILLKHYGFFGLFLFMCIAVLISKSFQLLFKLYSSVAERAIKDQRTGLYNHGYFEDALEAQLKQSKQDGTIFSVVVLDLDDFKKYNDTYGHLKGDQLLEFFGGLLKEHCDRQNIVLARYGGEEFTLIMPGVADSEASVFVNRLRKTVNDTYFEGVELFPHGCLSFSAGIAQFTKDIYDKNQLVDRADQALYYAKAQGKNCVHTFSDDSLLQRTIDIEQDLREIEQQLSIFLSKDIYTFQHSKRVYRYAIEMCDVLPLTDSEKKTLVLGALFHDIGKLEIPRDVLNKKGKLTADEWEMVKKHVLWGKEIASTNEKFKELLPLIELHHERYDGRGYPRGLKGEEIPKLARVLCIIDSFDAMTTERPYQKTKTFEEAIVELRLHAGKQFDPDYVEPFISIIQNKCSFQEDDEPPGSNAAG